MAWGRGDEGRFFGIVGGWGGLGTGGGGVLVVRGGMGGEGR